MNKTLRKILKITGITFGVLLSIILLAALLIPLFFKDDIKAAIDQQIAKSVRAQVNFEADKFGLSLFRNFPHITATLDDFSIVGRETFTGDTLTAVDRFQVTIDLWSVLFGDKAKIRRIYLKRPRIYAKVRRDGLANWDIFISEPEDTTKKEKPAEEEKAQEFNVGIRGWEIENGTLVYEDRQQKMYLKIGQLNHKGSGNFSQAVFDLRTRTEMNDFVFRQSGLTYLEQKKFLADITLNMNLPESKYTFKKNTLTFNDFSFGFDGFVQLKDSSTVLDLTYATRENEFKNILSLVPGMFTEQFSTLKTEGLVKMEGFLKGELPFDGSKLPEFRLDLLVKDGFFQYPDLPSAVRNVQMDLRVDLPKAGLSELLLDLKKLHLDFGKNPIEAKAQIKGVENALVDALVSARLNLAELSQMFPMPGLTMRGNFGLNLKAKGRVSATQLPALDARMQFSQGYIKTSQYPDAIEQLQLEATAKNSTGRYEDTQIRLNPFRMVLDKEPFEIRASFDDLADVRYDMQVKGALDLAKLLHLYPIEGMKMEGKVRADVQTKGRASYALNGQYDQMPTSGTTSLRAFAYSSPDLPQGLKITEAQARFSPQTLNLEKMDGFLGKSDIHATGVLTNYIGYMLDPKAVLKGVMDFRSDKFVVDEWMSSPDTAPGSKPASPPANASASSTPASPPPGESLVVEIPKNLDFLLHSELKEVVYTPLKIQNLQGDILIREGKLRMDKVTFNTLGGKFNTDGTYDPSDLLKPQFDFGFGIESLPVANLLNYSASSKPTSALTQTITGDLSTLLKVSGGLTNQLTPRLDESLNGNLSLNLIRGTAQNLPILDQLSAYTNLSSLKKLVLEDLNIKALIKDGQIQYEPFSVRTKSQELTMDVSGSSGLDGSLKMKVDLKVPKGKLGAIAATALQTIGAKTVGETLVLPLNVGGTYAKPEIGLATEKAFTETAKEKIKTETAEERQEIKEKIQEETGVDLDNEALREEARFQAAQIRREAREKAQKIKTEADAQEKRTVEEAAKKGLLAKKAAEVAAKKVKEEAYRKADQLVAEADRRAEQLIKEADARTQP
ncbi:MAG: hypothetical protein OHK0053_34320 [Microscillaceae bacterium]